MTTFFYYIYDINLLIITSLGIGLSLFKNSKFKTILFLFLTSSFILFIYTARYGIGYDYFNYYILLNRCKSLSFMDILLLKGPIEPGFGIILKLISFITNDIVIMYLILGIIIFSSLSFYIFKYSDVPWISMYLFVTFGFMFGIMNLVRQYFSAIIFLYAIKFIKQRNFFPYLLISLLAASIHKSALIIIPVYFIATLNISWKSLTFYASSTFLAYIFCDPIINFITQFVYKEYNLNTGELKDFMGGMPWKFVLVPFIYCLTALLMRKILIKKDPGNIILINFSIYTLMLWILLTRHLLLERVSNFLFISSIILGAQIVSALNPDNSIKNHISQLKSKIHQLKKNNASKKSIEAKNHDLKQLQEKYYEAKSYYITTIAAIIIIGFLNQIFAMSHGNHKMFPYQSIFNSERDIAYENKIKQIGNNNNE